MKEMEDLNKHQLILLTLLISFVTSIATGIITFTLLSEAPVEVTQTINRVVEKTIERVVPEEGKPEKVVTTVVVNEEDRVLDAISKNEKSIVRLKSIGADGVEVFSGIGLVVDNMGTIVFDLRSYTSGVTYTIVFYDGKSYSTGKTYVDNANGLVFAKSAVPMNESPKYTFYPATLGNSDNLKIGQTLVAIGGKDSNSALIGRVRQLDLGDDKKSVSKIDSDITSVKASPGSPSINLSGEIIGLEAPLVEGESQNSYIPINLIKSLISTAKAELAK